MHRNTMWKILFFIQFLRCTLASDSEDFDWDDFDGEGSWSIEKPTGIGETSHDFRHNSEKLTVVWSANGTIELKSSTNFPSSITGRIKMDFIRKNKDSVEERLNYAEASLPLVESPTVLTVEPPTIDNAVTHALITYVRTTISTSSGNSDSEDDNPMNSSEDDGTSEPETDQDTPMEDADSITNESKTD